jgi:hypothetical protein
VTACRATHQVYVQDKIREAAPLVWAALEAGGAVIVSGASEKMPTVSARAPRETCTTRHSALVRALLGTKLAKLELNWPN